MKRKEENSYRNILRRISAFGGVQVFNILINLVRGKFVAIFLGPDGMGVASMFTSSQQTIQQFGSLGLNLALVKETAAAKDSPESLPHVMAVALRLIILTSLLGGAVCLLGAPLLSVWAFGSADYTPGFMLLSASVALSIAATGYLALLQGVGAVKQLTKASLVGGLSGLLFGVPLYYFFGAQGIVPAMIILSATTFLFYFISFRKTGLTTRAAFDLRRHRPLIKRLLATGLVLMSGSLVGSLTGFLINTFVRSYGSIGDVGLFQAANSLTNQYVGIILSALALDFFPRLSAVADDDIEGLNLTVNRQIEIINLIVTPLIILLILTAPIVIHIFLTEEFMAVEPLMRWMGLGVLIQTTTFPLGYILLSKSNSRLYFWLEVVMANLLWIGCSVGFYWLFGLIGLGVSVMARSLIGDSVAYLMIRRYYGFRVSHSNLLKIGFSALIVTGAFLASFSNATTWTLIPLLLIISIAFSAKILTRRLRNQ